MKIILESGSSVVLGKKASNFGNSAHVSVPKKFVGKTVKLITGSSKLDKKELNVSLFGSEILERKILDFGTGAHIIIPKEYSGSKIKLIIEGYYGQE